MHYSQSEKYEIIQLVEQSDLGINRTLKELKINKTTFYNWYNLYTQKGFEGLARKKSERVGTWNKINIVDRDKVVEIALEKPELSSREVAWHITDNYFRIRKAIPRKTTICNHFKNTPAFLFSLIKFETLPANKAIELKTIKETKINNPPKT